MLLVTLSTWKTVVDAKFRLCLHRSQLDNSPFIEGHHIRLAALADTDNQSVDLLLPQAPHIEYRIWSSMRLSTPIVPPLNLLLPPETMAKLNELFVVLLHLHRTDWELGCTWGHLKSAIQIARRRQPNSLAKLSHLFSFHRSLAYVFSRILYACQVRTR